MAGVLLYQSAPPWRIGAALGAAALIHLAAIVLASSYPQEQIDGVLSPEPPVIEFEPASPPDDSKLPADTVTPNLNEDATDKLFADERTIPPSIRRQDNRLVVPRARARNGSPGSLTFSSAKVLALSAPRPEYPYEARRQKITGDGIVVLTVHPVTGNVIDVSMWKSTGNLYLDNAAITGFRRWRFKPGTVSRVKSPITYTLTGASY